MKRNFGQLLLYKNKQGNTYNLQLSATGLLKYVHMTFSWTPGSKGLNQTNIPADIYLLKVNNKYTRTTSFSSHVCSSVSIANFENVIAGWLSLQGT